VDAPANRSWYQAAKKKEERGTRVRLEQFVGTGGSMGGEIERARGQLTDRMGSAVVEGRVVSICGSVGITLIHTHTYHLAHSPMYEDSSTESRTFAPTSLGSDRKLYTSSMTVHRAGNMLVEGWLGSRTVNTCREEPSECRVRPSTKRNTATPNVRRAACPDGSRTWLPVSFGRMRCSLRQHRHCGLEYPDCKLW
jgi:hypothetical protein